MAVQTRLTWKDVVLDFRNFLKDCLQNVPTLGGSDLASMLSHRCVVSTVALQISFSPNQSVQIAFVLGNVCSMYNLGAIKYKVSQNVALSSHGGGPLYLFVI